MKTAELAKWLGLGTSTLRLWTNHDFKQYLSPTAQGGSGRVRSFTELDARIIGHVARLKAEGIPLDEIHTALDVMRRDEWRSLPDMPPAPPGAGAIALMPREAAESAITSQRTGLLREISLLQDRVETLEEQLHTEQQRRTEVETELKQTYERLGELRGQLAERMPTKDMLRLLVVVAVIVAVIVLVIVVVAVKV